MRLIAGAAGYLVLFAVATLALEGRPAAASFAGHAGLLVPPAVVCLVVLRRRKDWRGSQRVFWDVIATGAALWIVGHLGWAYQELQSGQQTWLSWHTVFTLTGSLAPLLALLARPYLGPRVPAVRHVSLSIGAWGLLAVFLYVYFVLVPSLALPQDAVAPSLFRFVHASRLLLVVATVVSLAAAWATPWRTTFQWLAGATALGAALRFVTSAAIADNAYAEGSFYDLAWIVPALGVALAAQTAPESPDDLFSGTPRAQDPSAWLAVPVVLIPLVGYGWLLVQPLRSDLDSMRALMTGVLTIAGIGALSLRLASQGTELVQADSRLRLLAAATEQTADLILIVRANGEVEHANDAFVRALGFDRADLVGRPWQDLIHPTFHEAAEHIRSEINERGIWRGAFMRLRRDETMFPAACTVVALKEDGETITHYVSVERDITEEMKTREQLVHSERLEAVGDLIAGVAHEINNPLQTIIGSVELLMEERCDEGTRRDLQIVRREATRAAQIVRNLISFVRRGGTARAPADLNQLVQATAEMREFHLQQRDIALHMDLAPMPLDVLANREEIQQLVLNLLMNAEQAILSEAESGAITLRTFPAGEFHAFEISDTGPGVPEDNRGRIFEPFFTTRPVGEGTGLGLAISHGIAASHGGSLELQPGKKGATFRLTLPAMASIEPPPIPLPADIVAGGRIALVVDDEAPIRRLLVRLLERRGYAAYSAASGDEALTLAERHPPEVVLCDVRMPGMTGPELYRALNEREPRPKRFIFITGDTTAIHSGETAFSDVPVLSKPFTAAALDAVLTTSSRS